MAYKSPNNHGKASLTQVEKGTLDGHIREFQVIKCGQKGKRCCEQPWDAGENGTYKSLWENGWMPICVTKNGGIPLATNGSTYEKGTNGNFLFPNQIGKNECNIDGTK